MELKKTGLFLQVRLNSSRMPGKALIELHNKPLISQVMERLLVVPADYKVILTSEESAPLLKPFVIDSGWEIFVGSTQNVLKRFVDAAIFYKVDTIIRATGDNPLLSSEIALETIELLHKTKADLAYLSSIPYGSGVEVVSTKALITALQNTIVPYHLEHVTPYIYENRDKFKVVTAKFHDELIAREDIRITVDTREDYEKANFLFRELRNRASSFNIKSVVEIWDKLKFEKYKRLLIIFNDKNKEILKRTILFCEELRDIFEIYFSFRGNDYDILDIFKEFDARFLEHEKMLSFVKETGLFERVIVDVENTDIENMNLYNKLGPVISINDYGNGGENNLLNITTKEIERDYSKFNYYLENLTKKELRSSNIVKKKENKEVFVYMGEFDSSNQAREISLILRDLGYKVKVFVSKNYKERINFEGIEIIEDSKNISDIAKKSDFVVTTFSYFFFDCLKEKIPTILTSSSLYIDEIIDLFNYDYKILFKDYSSNIETLKPTITSIIEKLKEDNIFKDQSKILNYYNNLINSSIFNIDSIIKEYKPSFVLCPYCCNINPVLIYRSQEWNMFKCNKCSLIFTISLFDSNNIYNNNYFFEEYKNLYGKTYEEDRETIRNFGKRRLKNIKKYKTNGTLLDFGAGLGFFAEYCEENGFKTLSIDISEFAVQYIKEKLGLNAICSDHTYLEKSTELFDVITSFYVIEHIKDFEKLIFLFYCHLKQGGCLALSTPNAHGISIIKNFNEYIKKHPKDHYRIFSPKFLTNLLKKYNFKKIKVISTGIHPERFLKNPKLLQNKIIRKTIEIIAKIFRLGDTFEIYAEKR
ncbi:MAG TPA: bifunctional glycosyltransferase/class I SAM-dependent methyltransferase [Spirochaetota bacterium]|nr:bifunctional glycosyltransferase/class I SAM-dependent methyltransferase [Spirochaetota bacterium]HOL57272.1 bifunctional glycosyltransferase/class I SAM-dependent methyltransferase [Spirochaetota bacterium]HPP04848.1 bifunctional glycosyltransferase/class I SAM-dependent methyltransferase [Spirochaetota bacterium]